MTIDVDTQLPLPFFVVDTVAAVALMLLVIQAISICFN